MSILDEVAEAQEGSRIVRCRVCAFLLGRPEDERAEWQEVMDSGYQHEAIAKALRGHGLEIAGQAVGVHRKSERCLARLKT